MKALKKLSLLVLLLLQAGCFRNNTRTETFEIEQLRSQEAAQIIANALSSVPGIKDIRPDIENRKFTVVFNGLESYIKNIEYCIVKTGFDLPNWPADPADKAKLPKELR